MTQRLESASIVDQELQFNTQIKQQTALALLSMAYHQSIISQITSFFCATILFIGLYTHAKPNTVLWTWYLAFLFTTIFRITLAKIYAHYQSIEHSLQTWKKLFTLGAFLGGLCWGIAGSELFALATPAQQTLTILIIAGVTAGAMPVLAAQWMAAHIFLSVALVPLMIELLFNQQNSLYLLFDFSVLAYSIYLVIFAKKTHHLLAQSIGLKYTKQALEQEIQFFKQQLLESRAHLDKITTHDLLTTLPNRKLFMAYLSEAIKRAEISQKNFALLYINLDNFKFINEAYGHEIGDVLLKKIVQRLLEILGNAAIVCRVGGDEFTILLENMPDAQHIKEISQQLCQQLGKQFIVNDYHLNISVSLGISVYPTDSVQPESLVKKAEKAMQYVKEHEKNNFRFSTEVK